MLNKHAPMLFFYITGFNDCMVTYFVIIVKHSQPFNSTETHGVSKFLFSYHSPINRHTDTCELIPFQLLT
jgi:hypothetical protein